jgi:Putative prokaryotic signal transducing protein
MGEVPLTIVHDELEAETLCGLLRVNKIGCFYRRTNFGAGSADGSLAMGGPFEVVVDEGDLADAQALLPRG